MLVSSDIDVSSPIASLQKYDYFGESSILHYFFGPNGSLKSKAASATDLDDSPESEQLNYHYLECCDVKAGSAVELLVLPAIHFELLNNLGSLHLIKSAFLSRMVWRMDRSDLVHIERNESSRSRTKLLQAALIASVVAENSSQNNDVQSQMKADDGRFCSVLSLK